MADSASSNKIPRVAIFGHRGIPSSYGGFETFAEEIGKCLVRLGCETTAYCRSNYFKNRPKQYHGIKLVYLPTITHKQLDTFVHSFLTVFHIIFKNTADVVLVVNVGNAPFALIAKLFGKKVIFCVDGLDWERKKWGFLAKIYLRICSRFARLAAHTIVTDAGSVQEFYRTYRHAGSSMIPYGTEIDYSEMEDKEREELEKHGLKSKNYFIYVARFEPENNPLLVVEAHVRSGSTIPLVMIGDNRYNRKYVEAVKKAGNKKVIFLGYVFGESYKIILKNALAYIRAAEVGGASPAVIEAMGRGLCIIANDKPENKEMLGATGIYFNLQIKDLSNVFKQLCNEINVLIERGKKSQQRAILLYNWDKIGYEYFKLIKKLVLPPQELFSQNLHAIRRTHNDEEQKILMTGAGGMLGEAFYKHFKKNYIVEATDVDANEPWLSNLDVRNFKAFNEKVKSFHPHYIFHLAALTNLEECEKFPANAYTTNALASKHAAQLASHYGIKLVYVSSAGVFDGKRDSYTDDDEPNPVNVYGLTKQMGAFMVEYYAPPDHITIRPGWMMGGGPKKDKKFVGHILNQIKEGKKEIYAVNDKFGTPSYTHDLARNLYLLLKKDASGVYNMVCNGKPASRYDIAKEIVSILGYEKEIKVISVPSSYFSETFYAIRPKYENLVNRRLTLEGNNIMRTWQEALKEYLERYFADAFKK